MYIFTKKRNNKRNRTKTARLRAKAKSKNRRRVNRMHGRPLGRRVRKTAK